MAKAREEKEKYLKIVKEALAQQYKGDRKGIDQIKDQQQLQEFVQESEEKETSYKVEILGLKQQLLSQ